MKFEHRYKWNLIRIFFTQESPQPVMDAPSQPQQSNMNPPVAKPVAHHPQQPAMQPTVQPSHQPVQMIPQQPAFLQSKPFRT